MDNLDVDEFEDEQVSDDNNIFQQAAEYVQLQTTKQNGQQLDQKKMLELYGFYKVATIGKCNEPKPGLFDLRGKAKWSAWTQVSNMTKEEAIKNYIDCVKKYYNWNPIKNTVKNFNKSSSCGGNTVSTLVKPKDDDNDLDENENTIFSWAKDNLLESIKLWLEDGNDPNIQDDEGMSPLHWAVDRGHLDTCILLIQFGANCFVKDNDGQTSLDYAITCEHQDIITLLEAQSPIKS